VAPVLAADVPAHEPHPRANQDLKVRPPGGDRQEIVHGIERGRQVGVPEAHDPGPRPDALQDAQPDRLAFAPVGRHPEDRHAAGRIRPNALLERERPVAAPIVHEDEADAVVRREELPERAGLKALGLVVAGHDQGEQRRHRSASSVSASQ